MKTRWITPLLGTAAASDVLGVSDAVLLDVRDLVDKAGNAGEVIREKIRQGVESLALGRRTIVCCDHGMSRSNAIATGILASFEKKPFDAALRRVYEATGEAQIKLEPLDAVCRALGLHNKEKKGSKQRSILVTGANGFVGQGLCAAMGSEFRVVAPSRGKLDIGLGSTGIDLLVAEEDVDCIVHLANPRVHTSNLAMGQTLTMLRNIIDVCLAREIPLIYPSSTTVYSNHEGRLIANESTAAIPRGPDGETKYLAELLIEHSSRTLGLRRALLRSSPVYGGKGTKPRFIYNFIEKARASLPIVTHRYDNGDPALDLLHVDDLVSALIATLKTGFTGVLNLGTGTLTTTHQIAQTIRDSLGSKSSIEQIPVAAGVASIAVDWRRAEKDLQWQPTIAWENGLKRLLGESEISGGNHGK